MLVLALAAIAIAQTAVTNTYDVDGSTLPAKPGSKKNPIPIQINFDYTVGEVENRRPSPVEKYSIRFGGTQVNTNVAARCRRSVIDSEGPDGCPAGSKVGSGYIENATGQTSNPNDTSIQCNAKVTVINEGDRKANIYVEGSPSATDPREKCAIALAAGIPANFVRRGNETALEFTVPESLRHPGTPNLSNAVKRVQSRVRRVTKRIRGKRRGYFEAIGGCRNGSRLITVVFTPESGPQATAQHRAPCR
ncbi:MAG: hypothetical protein M3320_10640 [Actinomycetota bacterium]|nr:hypothetical protein [Actinomycetota bacterium]